VLRRGLDSARPGRPAAATPRFTPRRRGGTTAGLAATLLVLGTLTAAAVVFAPRFGSAGMSSSNTAAPPHERQLVANQLASLLGSSRAVLAVHQRGATPYVEAVVWVDDRVNRGTVDPMEVAVLSHSRVLQTVTWFTVPAVMGDRYEHWSAFNSETLAPGHMRIPAFCDRWRAHQDVAPRVIATGISDLHLQELPHAGQGTAALAIELIWPANSTDSPTETSAQAHVAWKAE